MRKKAWKKNIAILLVIAMMLTIMPMTVFAEGEDDGAETNAATAMLYGSDGKELTSLSPAEEVQAVIAKWVTEEQQATTVYVSWNVGDNNNKELSYDSEVGGYIDQQNIVITDAMIETGITATFSTDDSELATASCVVVQAEKPESGTVAQIGETQYETLDEAIAAVDDDTIELLADCTTEGLNIINKDLTINGAGKKITFSKYGIYASRSKLTFMNCVMDMQVSNNPSASGATANLISNTDIVFDNTELDLVSDGKNVSSGIYLYQESNLYIKNGSKMNISGFKLGSRSSGIYADNSEYDDMPNRNIVIDNSVVSITNCGWHGMTINPIDLTVKNGSLLSLEKNGNEEYGGGLGCYYGKLIVEKGSTVSADNNSGSSWGIFVEDLYVDGTSTLSACNNVGTGLTVGGEGIIQKGATVRLNENNNMGLWVYSGSDYWYGDVTIEDGTDIEICSNKDGGIYNTNKLTLNAGKVMYNTTTSSGGGIYNKSDATAIIAGNVSLYNNHANESGDDIYNANTGAITFDKVGDDWVLDDCSDAIDGWYYDGYKIDVAEDETASENNTRWNAHFGKSYTEEYTDAMANTEEKLALKAAHKLPEFEAEVPPTMPESKWEVSRSKTATNLDENFESKVTLSLPSAEEKLVTDVVFVLDESSCSEPVKAEVAKMLSELYTQVKNSDATVKIGAVQFRGEVTKLDLTELTETTKDTVTQFMDKRPETGGSNMSAGLLAGKAMLDEDTKVSSDRKYLILVSDGITYIWDDENTETQENYGINFANGDTPNIPMLAGPDGWDVKNGRQFVPDDWSAYLLNVGKLLNRTINDKASLYVRGADISKKPFISYPEKDDYVSTVDIALYKSYLVYQRIASAYPNTYVVMTGVESEINTFPFGPSFMNYMANEKSVSFENILNKIIYLVDKDSYVEDYMGYVENDYDFDFVNEASAMTLTVGEESYNAVKIADNQYGFKPIGDDYAYTVAYSRGDGKGGEHFVWKINEPVTNFAPVQLIYTVKLMNPKTEAGTYGEYDADGSNDRDGLYTNNSATLYPIDSTGAKGDEQVFAKPTVSYTVEKTEPGPGNSDITRNVTKVWKDDATANRPDSITVNILYDGSVHQKVTLNAANDWTYAWKTSGGGWTVEEANVPAGYTSSVSTSGNDFIITNTYTGIVPEEPIMDPDVPTTEPDVPSVVIDEPGVPTTDIPGTPVNPTEIAEPEVPLGDAPKTGDAAPTVAFVGLMAAAVVGLVITRRKFN